MVFNKVCFLILLIGTVCKAMQEQEGKGKEKEPFAPTKILELPKEGSLILCAPVPSTPLSQRHTRALSLSLNAKKQQLQPRSSRRYSLGTLNKTESEFDLNQKKLSLFNVLEIVPIPQAEPPTKIKAIESWFDTVYLNGTSSYVPQASTMQQLQEGKFGCAKFIVGLMKNSAEEENDADHIKYAQRVEKRILGDQNTYFTHVYLQSAAMFKKRSQVAHNLAVQESDVRRKSILYNCALALCKEARDFYDNAQKNNQDVKEDLDTTWKLLALVNAKLHMSKDYDAFRKQVQIAGNVKDKAQKTMKEIEQLEKKIAEKQQKINTPRTRTSKFTLNPRLKNKDAKKIKKIIKKRKAEFIAEVDANKKRYLQSVIDNFTELKKSKSKQEFYKKILEYKVEKLQLRCIELLSSAESTLMRSSQKYIKAYNYNPQLPLIIAIKDNIDRIKRAQAKRRNLGNKRKIQSGEFNELQDDLRSIKNEVQLVMKTIYQLDIV